MQLPDANVRSSSYFIAETQVSARNVASPAGFSR